MHECCSACVPSTYKHACACACMHVCMHLAFKELKYYFIFNGLHIIINSYIIHKYTIFNEPLQREPAAPVHSVASRQLTGGNIVHLVLPSMIVSGANSAICSNEQTWKQPSGPIHHTLQDLEGHIGRIGLGPRSCNVPYGSR